MITDITFFMLLGSEYAKLREFYRQNAKRITKISKSVADVLTYNVIVNEFYISDEKLSSRELARRLFKAIKEGRKPDVKVALDMRAVLCSLAQLIAGTYDTIKRFNDELGAKILINAAIMLANELIINVEREEEEKKRGEDICVL